MLKIFKNIRRQLIESKNMKKYIFYTVGEILFPQNYLLLNLKVIDMNNYW